MTVHFMANYEITSRLTVYVTGKWFSIFMGNTSIKLSSYDVCMKASTKQDKTLSTIGDIIFNLIEKNSLHS